jgi:hypothetical protein
MLVDDLFDTPNSNCQWTTRVTIPFERASAAVTKRANRVGLLLDAQLEVIRGQCLKELEASRSRVAKFYGR